MVPSGAMVPDNMFSCCLPSVFRKQAGSGKAFAKQVFWLPTGNLIGFADLFKCCYDELHF